MGLDKACWFDFPATVQLIPDSQRDSLFAAGQFKLNENTTLFAEAVASQFDQRARYAPGAQTIAMSLSDPYYQSHVLPYLATLGVDPANVNRASTNNRFVDAGGRTNLYKTAARHLTLGVEGQLGAYDYSASYVHSTNERDDLYDGGYMSRNCYNGLVSGGKVNPFALAGGNTALFAPCVLHELATRTKTALDVLSLRGSGEVFKLPAGAAMLGAGFDYSRQQYDNLPSAINQGPNKIGGANDTVFGSAPGALPVGATRSNWGVFGELLLPLHKTLDLTTAVRWDDYGRAHNRFLFKADGTLDAPGDQGNANSKATYKLALRFSPVRELMLRASLGTGFKVANLDEITQPLQDFGVTSGRYACPVKAPDPRAVNCIGTTQYDLLTGGNPLSGELGLKPEESKNRTLGFRLEPSRTLSFGADYWSVTMKNQIVALPESFPFRNPGGLRRPVPHRLRRRPRPGQAGHPAAQLQPWQLALQRHRLGAQQLLGPGLRQAEDRLERHLHAALGGRDRRGVREQRGPLRRLQQRHRPHRAAPGGHPPNTARCSATPWPGTGARVTTTRCRPPTVARSRW